MSSAETEPLLGSGSDEESRGSTAFRFRHPSTLSTLEKVLLGLTFLLLTTSAVFSGLFFGNVRLGGGGGGGGGGGDHRPHKSIETVTRTRTIAGPTPTAVPPHLPEGNDAICLTASCVETAASILTALDDSVDPCDDFYAYANNGWLKANPIPAAKASYGIGEKVTESNKRIIQTILAHPPSRALPSADQTNLQHLRSFYTSCMNETRINEERSKPIIALVEKLIEGWRGSRQDRKSDQEDGFIVQQEEASSIYDGLREKQGKDGDRDRWNPATRKERLTAALSFLHSRDVPSLFEFYLEGDVKEDPRTLVLWLQQTGLSLPSKDYYKVKGENTLLRDLQNVIRRTLENVYGDELKERVNANDLAASVVELERRLAKASLDTVDLADPELTYNKYNASTIESLFPSISFSDYFAGFSPRPTYPGDMVIVTSPDYLRAVASLLDREDDDVLEAYFVFKIAQAYGNLLGSDEPIKLQLNALKSSVSGIPSDAKPARNEVCLTSLLDNLGFLAGRYYVQEAFGGKSKEYAEEVVDATIEAFRERLENLDWMEKDDRKAADQKARSITRRIGYPTSSPNTSDPISLERYYALNLPILESDYFGNNVRSRVADQKRLWAKIGKERDGSWEMIPSEVNAYYNPSSNEIVFPAGILQEPYFNKDRPEYLVFGAFGSVSGHELSHAFDSTGRQYDAEGKLNDWWSQSTIKRFEKLTECFLKQYANYTVVANGATYHINSAATIGEDMADAGGLSQSFAAWKKRFESDQKGKEFVNYRLPGLDYTREQLFFIAFAQSWARSLTPEEAIRRIRVDPHSPTNYRVIGPLSNNEEFSRAFKCKKGDRMSRVDKCQIW